MFNFSRCYKHMSQTYLDEQGPATVYEFQLLHNLANIWYCQSFSFQSFEGVAQTVKRLSAMQETRVRSLGWEDPLEKEMAIHSSTRAWKIPWTEEPGRLQSMGSQRVGHDWATSLHFKVYAELFHYSFNPSWTLSHVCHLFISFCEVSVCSGFLPTFKLGFGSFLSVCKIYKRDLFQTYVCWMFFPNWWFAFSFS